jgi:hypothetical protein
LSIAKLGYALESSKMNKRVQPLIQNGGTNDGGKSNTCTRLVLALLPVLGCSTILAVLYLLTNKLDITVNDSSVSQALADYEPNIEILVLIFIGATLMIIVTICRDIQINVYHRRRRSTTCGMKTVNFIAAFANITAYIGFVLVASFKVDSESEKERQLHSVGSYVYFGLSGLYGLLHTFLLWKQTQYPCVVKVVFTIVPLITVACSIIYAVKMEEAFAFEWITVALAATFVGMMSILFCIDPVDDELRAFFCCRRGGDKSNVRTSSKRTDIQLV